MKKFEKFYLNLNSNGLIWKKGLKRKRKKRNLPHLTFRPNSPAAHLTSPVAARLLFFFFFFFGSLTPGARLSVPPSPSSSPSFPLHRSTACRRSPVATAPLLPRPFLLLLAFYGN
jgi:hypothetical protein